jgi:hypothetical protein
MARVREADALKQIAAGLHRTDDLSGSAEC